MIHNIPDFAYVFALLYVLMLGALNITFNWGPLALARDIGISVFFVIFFVTIFVLI